MKRSKRHALAAAAAPKPPLTRRQLSRRVRERRLLRNLLAGVGAALLISLFVLAYGYWREVVRIGDQPIVEVSGQPITTESYARYLAVRQALVDQQMANVAQAATAAGSDPSKQPYQQQLDLLQQERSGAFSASLTQLAEGVLLRREAASRGIEVTEDEINEEIIAEGRLIRDGPAPIFTSSSEGEQDPSSSKPMTLDEAKAEIRAVLSRAGNTITEDEYWRLAIEPRVLRDRLTEELGKDVPTTAEQVHARHILVEKEDEATAIKERLEKGEDFATLARELSKDSGTKEKGGDLGWFARGVMVREFEDAAFAQEPGAQIVVVQSSFGWHVMQVLEKDANRPLTDEQLREARLKHFNAWLRDLEAKEIVSHASDRQLRWAQQYADEMRKAAQSEA